MTKKINMNEKEIATYMRTHYNSWCESLMKRTTVMRRISYFPRNSNQCTYAYVLYDTYGNLLDVIVSNATSPISLRAVLPERITVIDDLDFLTLKSYQRYMAYKLDW